MTEFALAPATKWDVSTSPYRSPRVMLEQNELAAYRVRGNGTMRHVSLYPLHSTDREVAEYVSDRTEFDGASVTAVARELHVSTATVRRFLEGLELTEEIEEGEWDGLSFDATGQPVWDTAYTEESYEDPYDTDSEGRNVAPTISPDAPGAHNEDEPTGTTADEVEAALAASLAQKAKDAALLAQNAARFTRAPRTTPTRVSTSRSDAPKHDATLAACFCGDQGAHGLGADGCKNPAPIRKVRSH